MRFKNTIASAALIISGLLSLSSAQAVEVVWNLNLPDGVLGTTQTYTAGGVTITAAGFAGLKFYPLPHRTVWKEPTRRRNWAWHSQRYGSRNLRLKLHSDQYDGSTSG